MYETGSAITSTGALTAYSGAKTGRSPLDKRIVKEEGSENDVWWGPVNKPMSPQVSKRCLSYMVFAAENVRDVDSSSSLFHPASNQILGSKCGSVHCLGRSSCPTWGVVPPSYLIITCFVRYLYSDLLTFSLSRSGESTENALSIT